MKSIAAKHWPLIAATLILCMTVAALLASSMQRNQGHLTYTLDDPYIHMAMAKNLTQHGVWGVTRYEFSSSSSSPIWVLLLYATYWVFGANELSPLILNVLFATLVVFSAYRLWPRYRPSFPPFYTFLALLGVVYLGQLPAIVFTGMEHVLHTLLTILLVYSVGQEVAMGERRMGDAALMNRAPTSRWLLVLAPLLAATRYEGLFVILAACVLFALRGRWLYALSLGILSVLPIGVYGLFSVAQGWFWLPNSVLLKSNWVNVNSQNGLAGLLGDSALWQLLATPHLLYLLLVMLAIYALRRRKGMWEQGQVMIALWVAASTLHLQFAKVGWYRYEAYLVALGVFVLTVVLADYLPRPSDKRFVLKYAAVFLLLYPILSPRAVGAVIQVPQATTNVFEEHYQMGLFVQQFYPGVAVAANDIGAINYLGDIRLLDVWGLGSLEVGQATLRGETDQARVLELAKSKGIQIAIMNGAADLIPPQWVKVGQWQISQNVALASDTIWFYAVEPAAAETLIENLRQFAPRLPTSVKQTGAYTE